MTSVLYSRCRPGRRPAPRPGRNNAGRAALFVAVAPLLAALTLVVADSAVVSAESPPPHMARSAAGTGVTLPTTPAGNQARWLVGAVQDLPLPAAIIAAHFDSAFLSQVKPAQLNAAFESIGPFRVESISTSHPDAIVFVVTTSSAAFTAELEVDGRGLINGLLLKPLVGAATSWAAVDSDVRSAAPTVHMLVARLGGGACVPIHSIAPATPGPLGSAFKLYVLDALASAISAGRVSWDQKLTLTNAVKSLPSGDLQNDPVGTRLTVLQVAANMISISDNTAADMLALLVGRDAVEEATRSAGMASPSLDEPFLTTREFFTLKLDDWPHLADDYLGLSASRKLQFLTTTVDRVPRQQLLASLRTPPLWTTPRDINSLEWFASPADMCRVYASLSQASRRPGLGNIPRILEINSGELGLPTSEWTSVWFKGGSETGVITLNYLATTRDGRTFVVSIMCENPSAPIPTAAQFALLSAAKGAFELAATAPDSAAAGPGS